MTLQSLRSSPVVTALAVWHTYGVWVGACIFLTVSSNLLLAWYIEWYRYQRSSNCDTTTSSCTQDFSQFGYGFFFALFLRAWMLIALVGEMARFCYFFAVDAWRVDSFQAYRRAVCGELWAELETEVQLAASHGYGGTQLVGGWSADMLSSWRRWLDSVMQAAIYFSLDIVPLGVAAYTYGTTSSVQDSIVALVAALAGSACVHVALFFIAWNLTDVCLKVAAFRKAIRGDNTLRPMVYAEDVVEDFHWAGTFGSRHLQNLEAARNVSFHDGLEGPPARCLSSDDLPGLGSTTSVVSGSGSSPGQAEVSRRPPARSADNIGAEEPPRSEDVEVACRVQATCAAPPVNSEDAGRDARDRGCRDSGDDVAQLLGDATAEKLNICIPFCGWISGLQAVLLPHVVWVGLVAAGLAFPDKLVELEVAGVGVAVVTFGWMMLPTREGGQSRCCLCWGGGSWRLWSLQAWGETYCSMVYDVQRTARRNFGIMVSFQGVAFVFLPSKPGVLVCCIALLYLLARHLLTFRERPWGWLFGIIEGLAVGIGAAILNKFWTPNGTGTTWMLVTIAFAMARQFGLARHNPRGYRVASVTSLIMGFMMVMVVGSVFLLLADKSGSNDPTSSFFCAGDLEHCALLEVPPKPVSETSGLLCQGRFAQGGNGSQKLAISDFGLFSALAYEPDATMGFVLQHYFPGWNITYRRRAGMAEGNSTSDDWTTFFEYTDASEETTVFAIQGTNSALDILDDINIWSPAAIMQGFSIIGPGVSTSVAQTSALLSRVLYPEAVQQTYFKELLQHVSNRQKQWPQRRLYLTGHSLGGGLAKLVASQTGIQAVTFMAPGLGSTGVVVFGEDISPQLRNTSLTVMPENDVISRVDTQMGLIERVKCDGNPLECHGIFKTVCQILSKCGSGRDDGERPFRIPCYICPQFSSLCDITEKESLAV